MWCWGVDRVNQGLCVQDKHYINTPNLLAECSVGKGSWKGGPCRLRVAPSCGALALLVSYGKVCEFLCARYHCREGSRRPLSCQELFSPGAQSFSGLLLPLG